MKLQVVVHEAEEGGFWAEVPAVPGVWRPQSREHAMTEDLDHRSQPHEVARQ